jgi:hypothetical protein
MLIKESQKDREFLEGFYRQFLRIIQIQDRLFADQDCSNGEEVAHEVVVNYHE